jgi:tight adherence protein C
MTAFVASLCFFLLIYTSAATLYMVRSRTERTIADRFAELVNETRGPQRSPFGVLVDLTSRLSRWVINTIPRRAPTSPSAAKLNQALVEAGYRRGDSYHLVRVLTVILTAVMGIAGFWLAASAFPKKENPILISLLFGGIGFVLPTYYVRLLARARRQAIAGQLADALDLLIVSVEAGLGLSEAIKVVGQEAERQKQEIGREFSLVAADMSAGATMGEALRGLAQRTAVDDMKPLVTTLIQSEQLGSRIGPALRASSDALRERRRLRAEEAAHKMTIKMIFPLGLLVLPAMIMLSAGPALIQVFRVLRH